jgi:hypothetical protein
MKLCLYIINVCISIDYIKIERNVLCEGSWISIHEFECPDMANKFDLKKNILKMAWLMYWLKII